MTNRLIIFLFLCAVAITSIAQSVISGKVSNAEGGGLDFVSVIASPANAPKTILASASPMETAFEEDKTFHRLGFNGALTSSDTWQLEFSYHYMFNRCIGLGGSVGSWKVYYEDGWASGKNWNIDEDDNKPWNFYLRPSVLLKTPALNYRACAWSLFAEPGVMLNIPYQRVCIESTPNWPAIEYDYISTTKGQWLAFDLRLGVSLDVGPCGISAGYMLSNLDVYSQYRHLSYKGISFNDFYPRKSFMQGAYISLSYNL